MITEGMTRDTDLGMLYQDYSYVADFMEMHTGCLIEVAPCSILAS